MTMDATGAAALATDVWRITTPLPFRPRQVHAYLLGVGGGEYLLVDGGIDTREAWDALDVGVREVAGGWRRVAIHLVTHMHLDHLGLARRVREASGARLLMSQLDADRARHADLHPDEEAEYRDVLLREMGAPAAFVDAVQAGRRAAADLSRFVEPDGVLDGERGDVPGVPGWEWIWTPGHTAGHLSLYRAADRLLVAGDAVLPRITPTIGVNRQRQDPVGDYLGALDRLVERTPARALPGHGEAIEHPALRVRELREATLSESARILALLDPRPATVWTVVERRYPSFDLPTATRMLACRETLAHLHHLVATRRAEQVPLPEGRRGFARAGQG
jgi:glyoxylase-like metal-dependent hydrolase (beta-lactamase superfamily II)